MIKSIRDKGLARFYEAGSLAGIQAQHARCPRMLLAALSATSGSPARRWTEEARQAAQANPGDAKLQARAAQAEQVDETLAQRAAAREAKGKPTASTSISPVEPEAVVQPQKDKKTFAPSYKPSVLANAARVIVGWDLDPSSETAVVAPMLDQAERLGGVHSALFDAGYHSDAVLAATAERGIEVLCPEGQALSEDDWTRQSDKNYPRASSSTTRAATATPARPGRSSRPRIAATARTPAITTPAMPPPPAQRAPSARGARAGRPDARSSATAGIPPKRRCAQP